GTEVTIDPADGQKRIWMVWAHWCPYCQDELPALAASYDDYAEQYPGISIATVTTSIDPTRGNPLDAYLEANQFPFPVLVDEDSSMAAQFGVSAFPFWVVTDGDGIVLLRSAGFLDEPQLASLIESLDAYEA
nr:TlpA disulfide reductase family protein [Acidimicrobiia bacterium]